MARIKLAYFFILVSVFFLCLSQMVSVHWFRIPVFQFDIGLLLFSPILLTALNAVHLYHYYYYYYYYYKTHHHHHYHYYYYYYCYKTHHHHHYHYNYHYYYYY